MEPTVVTHELRHLQQEGQISLSSHLRLLELRQLLIIIWPSDRRSKQVTEEKT